MGKIVVNWDLHHGIAHVKGQIGVVFQGQSSGEVKSAVQLHKSADRKAKLQIETYWKSFKVHWNTVEKLSWNSVENHWKWVETHWKSVETH